MNNHAVAFLFGFLTCFGCVCFPVVLALCLRMFKRAAKRKRERKDEFSMLKQWTGVDAVACCIEGKLGFRVNVSEIHRFWPQVKNVYVSLGYTIKEETEGCIRYAYIQMQEPKS